MSDKEKYWEQAGPCERCGHGPWRPRVPGRPVVCPSSKCKSPYWDKPRTRPAKVKAKA